MTSKVTVGWSDGSADAFNNVQSIAGAIIKDDFNVAASVTNQEHDIAFLAANIKAVVITADQVVTIKTNSSSVPDQTFILDGVSQVCWVKSGQSSPLIANPITVDVTKLYITTGAIGANGVNISIRVITSP